MLCASVGAGRAIKETVGICSAMVGRRCGRCGHWCEEATNRPSYLSRCVPLCVSLCGHACICVRESVGVCICVSVCACGCVFTCMRACICLCVRVSVCLCGYVCMNVCLCVCECVSACACLLRKKQRLLFLVVRRLFCPVTLGA